MKNKSKALYLGNTYDECCEFTQGREYDFYDLGDGFIGLCDDNDTERCIKNGTFYKFKLINEDHFVTETECASMQPSADKKPEFRYYINGEVVTKVKFDDTLLCVKDFESSGFDTSSIKFEVKFE